MTTDTNSVDENIYYKMCESSGTLDFWDEPGEDIYTNEDGKPINKDKPLNYRQSLFVKVKAYIEDELLRLMPETPNLEGFRQLEPAERYVECLRRRTENVCRSEELRVLSKMLSWVEQ